MKSQTKADCDCCGEKRYLQRVWYHGLETWACAKCRGCLEEPDDYDSGYAKNSYELRKEVRE